MKRRWPPVRWYVWETEYPEEGSMTFLATSHWRAKEKYRRAWGWRHGDEWTPELTATSKEPKKGEEEMTSKCQHCNCDELRREWVEAQARINQLEAERDEAVRLREEMRFHKREAEGREANMRLERDYARKAHGEVCQLLDEERRRGDEVRILGGWNPPKKETP